MKKGEGEKLLQYPGADIVCPHHRREAAKTEETPAVSVVIPVHNNLGLTISCVNSLIAAIPPECPVEIIIVDNGSTDGTMAWALDLEMKLMGFIKAKYIGWENNRGFGAACNRGFAAASHEFIMFVNNDTLIPSGLIEELLFPHPNPSFAGITAAVSNFAGGAQLRQADYIDERSFYKFAAEWRKKYQGQYEQVGMAVGLCIMGRKSILKQLVGFHAPEGQLFDETFSPGMWEDNDLCLRMRLKHLDVLIAQGAFIHHWGSRTFNNLKETTAELCITAGEDIFRKKWQAIFGGPEKQTVMASIRVKNGIKHIRRCLDLNAPFVDGFVILDTGSTDGTIEAIREWRELNPDTFVYLSEWTGRFNEWEEREALHRITAGLAPTWIMRLDVDEAFDEKMFNHLPYLLNPDNPEVLAWHFRCKTFWRGGEKYRADGVWGNLSAIALYRNIPGDSIPKSDHPQGFHCASGPIFHWQNIGFSSVNLLHWGYAEWDEAVRKYNWYVKTDTAKNPQLIGGRGDYSHLVDEREMSLVPYITGNTITLCMLLKDEYREATALCEMLRPVVDEIVILYTGQKENPLTRLVELGAKIVPFKWNGDYSDARNYALGRCTGKWILQLDPDETIMPEDVLKLPRLIEQDATGFVFDVVSYLDDPGKTAKAESVLGEADRLFLNDPLIRYTNPIHENIEGSLFLLPDSYRPLQRAGITIRHFGYLISPDKMVEKQAKYREASEAWTRREPNDPRPYYHLAQYYLESEDTEIALHLLGKAHELCGKRPIFYIEYAIAGVYLRTGLAFLARSLDLTDRGSPQRRGLEQLVTFLRRNVKQVPKIIGRGDENNSRNKGAKVDESAAKDSGDGVPGGDKNPDATAQGERDANVPQPGGPEEAGSPVLVEEPPADPQPPLPDPQA